MNSLTPSSSSSSEFLLENFDFKCEVCLGRGHGNHFGVNTCRACAAFFRRMIVGTGNLQRCRLLKKCIPRNGRWLCKKCRLVKCIELGMTPDNIQYERDAFSSSQLFSENHMRKRLEGNKIPKPSEKKISPKTFGLSLMSVHCWRKQKKILRTKPDFESKTTEKSTLEKLTFGLRQIRKEQNMHPLIMSKIGKEETFRLWESQLMATANWIMYFDEFRELPFHQKFEMLKCMWHIWGRLERLSMTAEMRVNGLCGKNQFVVSNDTLLDYNVSSCDVQWSTNYTEEELKCFMDPPTYFGEPLIESFINIKPTDTEFVFLLCNLCFRLTGKKLGGEIEEVAENLQDILADSLHLYYKEMEVSRYCHRITKLLSINNDWISLMCKRRENIRIARIFDTFCVNFSHPELFQYSV